MNLETDLIVVGGGVLGTFHAYHAMQRGLTVRLLEKSARPRGATVRNFGQVVPSGMDPHWQRLGRRSLEIYQSLQAESDLGIRNLGSIYLASDAEELTLIEELAQLNRESGYESALWTAAQCRQRFPMLRGDYCVGGLFFPQELSVDPTKLIHRLHAHLQATSQFQIHFQTYVSNLTVEGDRVVAQTTSGEIFRASKAIVCSGSEFRTLFPALYRASDLQVVKLQMMRLTPQPAIQIPGNVLTGLSIRRYESFSQCPSFAKIKAREDANSFWRKWGVHILFKQEVDGSIILGDSHEYASVAQADDLDSEIREEVSQYFIDEGKKIFDLPSWKPQATWNGVYSQTSEPSGIFTRTLDGRIHIATGIGGKGMTSSAGFAEQNISDIFKEGNSR